MLPLAVFSFHAPLSKKPPTNETSVLKFFLVSYCSIVLLFPVFEGNGSSSRCARNMTRATLSSFHRPQEKSHRVGIMK